MEMVPEVGVYSPTMSLSRVDLPVPFAPMSPVLSPGFICQLASSYNAREPISNVKLLIAIIVGRKDTGNPFNLCFSIVDKLRFRPKWCLAVGNKPGPDRYFRSENSCH